MNENKYSIRQLVNLIVLSIGCAKAYYDPTFRRTNFIIGFIFAFMALISSTINKENN